jgi:hypothetical protein
VLKSFRVFKQGSQSIPLGLSKYCSVTKFRRACESLFVHCNNTFFSTDFDHEQPFTHGTAYIKLVL